jgi:hypothetical protein
LVKQSAETGAFRAPIWTQCDERPAAFRVHTDDGVYPVSRSASVAHTVEEIDIAVVRVSVCVCVCIAIIW